MPTSPLPPDPYKVLGVPKDATTATIRSAHRKLVLQSHPDKFPDEAIKAQKADEFHRVQQAYELLSDEKTRERYDAQVRLAELKAERFREEAANSPRRQEAPPPSSPRPSSERVWSSQPIFEEIRPKARYHEDTQPQPPPTPSSRTETRYEDHHRHRSSRDPDDFDDFSPAQGTTRKTGSTRIPDTRGTEEGPNRAKSRWWSAASKVTESRRGKEFDDRRRTRDRNRRDDGQSKRHMRTSLDTETASDTESDVEAFMSSASHVHRKEASRTYDDDKYYARRKHESRHSSPDRETKEDFHVHSAAEYIAKTRGKVAAAGGRRPSLSRGVSVPHQAVPPPPPPPPPAPQVSSIDDAVRSSARRTTSGKTVKSSRRDPIEIVEPSRKRDIEIDTRRPDLKPSATSPTVLKSPLRSATLEVRPKERSRASVKRSATSPLAASMSASYSQKPSKSGRDAHDSGASSPDNQSARSKTTAYTVHMESASDSENGPRYVVINPDLRRPSVGREQSMHSSSHRSERVPTSAGSVRHGAVRSQTEEATPHHRPVPLSRNATDHPGMLYGEINSRASPEPLRSYKVQQSPRYGKEDVHYTPYQRRPSPGDSDSRTDHRSAYGQGRQGTVPIRAGRSQATKAF